MNLEKLQISLEPKGKWEAMDLGVEMVKSNFIPSMSLSFLMTGILFLLVSAVVQDFEWVVMLLFMLKPIIERPLLYYFSQAIFGEQPSIIKILKNLKGILWRQPLQSYTYRRFSPNRSFNDCVVLLEGLRNPQRRQRLKILHHQEVGSTWLTVAMVHIELLLPLAFYATVMLFLPESLSDALADDFIANSETSFYAFITGLVYAFIVALMAPFYVGCGFVLYLNRRSQLESWHIEVGFKKIQQRLSQLGSAMVLLLILILPMTQQPVWAEDVGKNAEQMEQADANEYESDEDYEADERPVEIHSDYPPLQNETAVVQRQAMLEILKSDVFGEHYQEKHYELDWSSDWSWDWLKWFEEKEDKDSSKPINLAWLEALTDFMVYLKWFIILVFSVLLAWVLYRYKVWHWLGLIKIPQSTKVEEVLGLNITKESLPSALHQTVKRHIDENEIRHALSLMFRAYVSQGVLQHNIPFKVSHTELECADLIRQHRPEHEANMFGALMGLWLQLAYAHQSPDLSKVNQVYLQWCEFVEDNE